jgi:hypothetical protein
MSSNLSAKEFNKVRAGFMRRASAPKLSPLVLKLAYVIAFKYMSVETQIAYPGQETLGADLNVSARTIRTLLDILEPLGLAIIPGHGPHRSSTYCLDPDRAMRESTPPQKRKPASGYKRKPASGYKPNTGNLVHDNRKLDVTNTGSQLPPNLTKRTKKNEPREESDSPASDPLGGNGDFKTQPSTPRDGSKKRKEETGAAFAEFWRAYPRRVARDAAARAFERAIERGADPAALIAGAQRYAAERAGQDPKYTKHPATWLNAGCWADEPAGDVTIDQQGNVVAVERPQQRAQPQGYAEAAEMLADELEANGGTWWRPVP